MHFKLLAVFALVSCCSGRFIGPIPDNVGVDAENFLFTTPEGKIVTIIKNINHVQKNYLDINVRGDFMPGKSVRIYDDIDVPDFYDYLVEALSHYQGANDEIVFGKLLHHINEYIASGHVDPTVLDVLLYIVAPATKGELYGQGYFGPYSPSYYGAYYPHHLGSYYPYMHGAGYSSYSPYSYGAQSYYPGQYYYGPYSSHYYGAPGYFEGYGMNYDSYYPYYYKMLGGGMSSYMYGPSFWNNLMSLGKAGYYPGSMYGSWDSLMSLGNAGYYPGSWMYGSGYPYSYGGIRGQMFAPYYGLGSYGGHMGQYPSVQTLA